MRHLRSFTSMRNTRQQRLEWGWMAIKHSVPNLRASVQLGLSSRGLTLCKRKNHHRSSMALITLRKIVTIIDMPVEISTTTTKSQGSASYRWGTIFSYRPCQRRSRTAAHHRQGSWESPWIAGTCLRIMGNPYRPRSRILTALLVVEVTNYEGKVCRHRTCRIILASSRTLPKVLWPCLPHNRSHRKQQREKQGICHKQTSLRQRPSENLIIWKRQRMNNNPIFRVKRLNQMRSTFSTETMKVVLEGSLSKTRRALLTIQHRGR